MTRFAVCVACLICDFIVRGDRDHHQRGPEDDEHRPKNEVGREDETRCGLHPGRWRHGNRRRSQTHPAEDQGVFLSGFVSTITYSTQYSIILENGPASVVKKSRAQLYQ